MVLATLGITIPNYVIATLMVYLFAYRWGIVTVGFWEGLPTSILPAITLAGYPAAFISRLTRSSMLEVIQQDYIRTAYSKGLRERTVVYIHALRNAIIPVVTYLGPLIAGILTDPTISQAEDSPITSIEACNGPYPIDDSADVAHSYLTVEYHCVGEIRQ